MSDGGGDMRKLLMTTVAILTVAVVGSLAARADGGPTLMDGNRRITAVGAAATSYAGPHGVVYVSPPPAQHPRACSNTKPTDTAVLFPIATDPGRALLSVAMSAYLAK